ncbi:SDR family NAD(P)-dependent oxidoreductase [Terricaulis silvestris]|uniref:D-xylose 1-dehydrogenase n=1 Tax=Terricaulis silvestris TaxID=2686094 RepID=A0A6I6MKM6_9CAUL|nr:SDR family oxidoreductase [Terricaulis silvestris]QGZ93778.1 3-beta-hydroxysteroid dehydrogenase [Terricaulis silvestris]
MKRLAGKAALVTGGACGIGRAIVERFAAEGAHVAIADIDTAAASNLEAELGGAAFHVRLDVTRDADWGGAIDELERRHGPLAVLVNNAGINVPGSIADAREEDWRRVHEVNGLGPFLGCQHAVRRMRASGGAIVNVASVRGQRPSSGQVAYCSSKALVLNLTESVALYCGEQNLPIRCNAICPGVVDTPLLRSGFAALGGEDEALLRLSGLQVMNRIGTPEEIAAAAVFLASDEASFVTGAAFNIDGGFRIRDQ